MNERIDLENWLKGELDLLVPDRDRIVDLCRRYVALHEAARAPTMDSLVPILVTDNEEEE